jgi:hypothetical protein
MCAGTLLCHLAILILDRKHVPGYEPPRRTETKTEGTTTQTGFTATLNVPQVTAALAGNVNVQEKDEMATTITRVCD